MPIDLTKIPSQLKDAVATGKLVPFIGAGISKQAKLPKSQILPDWPELIKEITGMTSMDDHDHALIEELVLNGKYLIAAQELKDRLESDLFKRYMRTRFQQEINPGRFHRSLFKLRSRLIMTTNYDLLLEAACAQVLMTTARVGTPARMHDVFGCLKMPWGQESPVIFKLHGTILEPDSIVLGERDYYNLIYRWPNYRLALRSIFMTKVVLMMGFSFSDPDIGDVLAEGRTGGVHGDFIVFPHGQKDRIEVRRLKKTFGVEVIEYEPSNGHPELVELIEYLARSAA